MTVAADVLLLAGVGVATLGVVGLFRLPDVYTQLHAAGKAAVLGVVLVLGAAALSGDAAVAGRAALVAAFLLLTTPVASHAVARAALLRHEPLQGHDAVDESGRGLDRR